jgi:hypothetical protein
MEKSKVNRNALRRRINAIVPCCSNVNHGRIFCAFWKRSWWSVKGMGRGDLGFFQGEEGRGDFGRNVGHDRLVMRVAKSTTTVVSGHLLSSRRHT